MIHAIPYDQVVAWYKAFNYPFHENAINVFGKRHKDMVPDKFDDVLGIAYNKKVIAVSGTTDPGKDSLLDATNKDGVFILQPGFYANCWHRGMHKGKYNALVQFGEGIFKGWRDNDDDGKFDATGKTWTNVQGLNFHTTRWDMRVSRVGKFSEGCQVVEVAQEYDPIIQAVYASNQSLFSYALFQMV